MPKRGQNQTDFSDVSAVSPRKKKGKEIHPQEETSGSTSAVEENLVSGILQGDTCSLYVLQLQVAQNAVIVLNTAATKFFLKDFNVKTRSLWDKHYVSLERKAAAFVVNSDEQGQQTDLKWLYHCSCSKSHGDLVMASAPHINMLYKDWLEMNPGCIHVQALGKQMQFFDDIYSISPTLEQEEEVTDSPDDDLEINVSETFIEVQHPNIIAVNPPSSSWGILSNSREGKKCLTCRPGISSCAHWDFIVDSINTEACPDFVIDFFEFCRTVSGQHMSPRGPKCLSYQKIPVTKFGSVKDTSDIPDVLSAINETGLCPFCEEERPLSVSSTSSEVTVFTQYKRKVVQAYSAWSDTCDHMIPFDGLDKGILNMTTFMVGHDVLRDYLTNFLYGRMPLYTFFRCWQQRQIDGGFPAEGMLSYFKFRMAWYSFLSLVEEDFKDYFICPICKDYPSLVIFDATSLAFRRSFVPKNPEENIVEQTRQRDAGRFKERVMINHKHTRDLLQSYCNSQRPLSSIDTLLSLLNNHSKAIKAVVEWCISQEGEHNKNLAPMYLRPLLISLAKPSPACALVPATNEAKLLLEKIRTTDVKKDPLLLQSLQSTCPLLFDVVKSLNLKDRSLPEAFDTLLTELWSKSIAPFEGNTCMQQSNEQTAQETDSFVDSIAFWPHLPSIRERGSYSQDRRREKQTCRKLGKTHKSLLPGTVTMHCEHGICYGFEVMLQVESPNTIFTILRTRFSIAPDVVIYDFGCGLHNYCLNREAKFFQNTKFLIDRYHQPNHKGCSLGYKMSLYPEFEKINSQLAEQKNSKLSRIKPQLAYMTPVNFMKHAQLFLGFCNKEVRVSLN